MSVAKNVIGGTFEDIGEAVIKPVVDEVGKALEQGAKSVVHGPGLTAQHTQGKQAEQQAKLAEARRKIKWWKDLEEAQRKAREEQKQKIMQQNSLESAQDRQIKQFEIVKKQEKNINLQRAQRKTEVKSGLGG